MFFFQRLRKKRLSASVLIHWLITFLCIEQVPFLTVKANTADGNHSVRDRFIIPTPYYIYRVCSREDTGYAHKQITKD